MAMITPKMDKQKGGQVKPKAKGTIGPINTTKPWKPPTTSSNPAYKSYTKKSKNVPVAARKTPSEFLGRQSAKDIKAAKAKPKAPKAKPKAPKAKPKAPTAPKTPKTSSSSSSTSSTEVTGVEKATAKNLATITDSNAQNVRDQLGSQMNRYDTSDKMLGKVRDQTFFQNSEKNALERFDQQKRLQSAAKSVIGAAGNGMGGSGSSTFGTMLKERVALDSDEANGNLKTNQNATSMEYLNAINANKLAREDAEIEAQFDLTGIETDEATQLNNIDPELFEEPGKGQIKKPGAKKPPTKKTTTKKPPAKKTTTKKPPAKKPSGSTRSTPGSTLSSKAKAASVKSAATKTGSSAKKSYGSTLSSPSSSTKYGSTLSSKAKAVSVKPAATKPAATKPAATKPAAKKPAATAKKAK